MFEIHFRDNKGIDKDKWRKQALSKWKSVANELHRDVQLDEGMNEIIKSWRECFSEALNDIRLKEYVRNNHHQKVFKTKDVAPAMDPVNFTPH
jgi:hypothetical protein